MRKRPLSILIIGCLFLITGIVGLADVADRAWGHRPIESNLAWIAAVRLLGLIGAVFLLRGSDWARWLLVIWMAFHVVLSIFHSPGELIIHAILLAVLVYFLSTASVALLSSALNPRHGPLPRG